MIFSHIYSYYTIYYNESVKMVVEDMCATGISISYTGGHADLHDRQQIAVAGVVVYIHVYLPKVVAIRFTLDLLESVYFKTSAHASKV